MKVIGIRKMAVIIWCAAMITVVMVVYACLGATLGTPEIMGITLIAGLGGFHSYKQDADDVINMPEKRLATSLDDKHTG